MIFQPLLVEEEGGRPAWLVGHFAVANPQARIAGSGLEVHGTAGSIFAHGVMTQRPVGRITLVTAKGAEDIPFPAHDLYIQSVTDFLAACAGRGRPAADGDDGIASLAVALAVRDAARTGQRQDITA